MPDRPSFPIPENPTPDTYCLQIVMPNDPTWKAVISGLLFQPAEWFNWQRNDEKTGKILAQYWREIYNNIDWSDMSCCCPEPIPPQYRFEGLDLYRSTDGGVTFVLAPEYDYRNTSIVFSKPSELGITSTKCQAADSVTAVFRDQMVNTINDDMSAATILGVIAAVILFFATAGTSSFISASVVGIVAAILTSGVTVWQAEFSEEVWHDFTCLIYCNMVDDESIDQAGLDAVYAGIEDKFDGIVVPTLRGYIAAAGLVGINNMMYGLSGDPDADCTDCDCPLTCPEKWMVRFDDPSLGTIDEVGEDYIICSTTTPQPNGVYYISIWTGEANYQDCCYVNSIEILTGSASVGVGVPCDDNGLPRGMLLPACMWWIEPQSTIPFSVKINLGECP